MLTSAPESSGRLSSLFEHLQPWIGLFDATEWTVIGLIVAAVGYGIRRAFDWRRNRILQRHAEATERQAAAVTDQADEIRRTRLADEDRLRPKLKFTAARLSVGPGHPTADGNGSVFEGWQVVNDGFVNVLVTSFQLEQASSQSARLNRKTMPSLSPISRFRGEELTTLKTPHLLRPKERLYVYYPLEGLIDATAPASNDGAQAYIRPECWDSDRNVHHPDCWTKWDNANEITYTDLPE